MKDYTSPVYRVISVPLEKIQANAYNPNIVAPPEMELLELSIWEDGYTMPCVCYYLPQEDRYELVDGYHRYKVMQTSKRIYEPQQLILIHSDVIHDPFIRHPRPLKLGNNIGHQFYAMCPPSPVMTYG